MNRPLCLIALMTIGSLFGTTAFAEQARVRRPAPTAQSANRSSPPPAESQPSVKVIAYGEREVAHISTKVRYSTLIILPKEETILDYVCGDKDVWVINGEQNFAYVKPAQENLRTNLNLITASGNVYTFVLTEITGVAGKEPDLKVFVEPKDPRIVEATQAPRRLASVRELEDYQKQLELAKEETQQLKQASEASLEAAKTAVATNVRFPYVFAAGKKPFGVRAIYHDDRHTYILARPEETPTLYELVEGNKPNLLNFSYNNGIYVVPKILDRGYLVVGKQRLAFRREE